MNANVYIKEDYENETTFRPKKTNPNKPNSNPIKACPELAEALSAAEGAVEWANFRQEMPNMPYLPALFYLRIYDINLRPFFSIKINEAIFRNNQSKRF